MPHDLTHLCERCHRHTELYYCRAADEYLCDDCVMETVRASASTPLDHGIARFTAEVVDLLKPQK